MDKHGKTTSLQVVGEYEGFDIVKVTVKHHYESFYGHYDPYFVCKTESYYTFCKHGENTRPSQFYNVECKSRLECIECITKFLEDDSLYFTEAEREKYIYTPNRKNQWCFNYSSIMALMRQHQKATKRIQVLLEDRLEDANFHGACGLLCKKDYAAFEAWARVNLTLREKFEVYTNTQKTRMKDPKRFEEGLAQAIAAYLATQNVPPTSVEVKFIENW